MYDRNCESRIMREIRRILDNQILCSKITKRAHLYIWTSVILENV